MDLSLVVKFIKFINMKNFLLLLSTVSFFTANIFGQEISNGTFEEWESVSGTSWKKPKFWNATDKVLIDASVLLAVGGFPVSAENQLIKNIDTNYVHEGEFSALLMSKNLGETFGVTPCMMSNGKIEIDLAAAMEGLGGGGSIEDLSSVLNITGGTPILGRKIDSVVAYVNAPMSNSDSATIVVQAKRKVAGVYTTIGGGTVMIGPGEGFQHVNVGIVYADAGNTATDTMVIMISSSAALPTGDSSSMFGATDSNHIFVDDISVFTSEGVSGIGDVPTVDLGVNVYPIPADQYIHFNNQKVANGILVIYDLKGRIMHQQDIHLGLFSLDLSQYNSGLYFYQILDTDHQQKQIGKFLK